MTFDYFNRDAGSACIGSCMSPQIMRSKMNAHLTAGFCHHGPRSLIAYRENSLMGLNVFLPDVIFESVSEPLRDEDEFLLSATLGVPEGQSPLMYI